MDLLKRFQAVIQELEIDFKTAHNDLFFTEKDLHAHFYHLCKKANFIHKNHGLVHTEYPTPFKCGKTQDPPYFEYSSDDSQAQRAHIDLVLINPNYIDFATNQHHQDSSKFISGVGNSIFKKHIGELRTSYRKFYEIYEESILLYALEFKFFRHTYSGEVHPSKEVHQDLRKLQLIKHNESYSGFSFCDQIQSIIFVGDRASAALLSSLRLIADASGNICKICERDKANPPLNSDPT